MAPVEQQEWAVVDSYASQRSHRAGDEVDGPARGVIGQGACAVLSPSITDDVFSDASVDDSSG
jgi:hypothetical protein